MDIALKSRIGWPVDNLHSALTLQSGWWDWRGRFLSRWICSHRRTSRISPENSPEISFESKISVYRFSRIHYSDYKGWDIEADCLSTRSDPLDRLKGRLTNFPSPPRHFLWLRGFFFVCLRSSLRYSFPIERNSCPLSEWPFHDILWPSLRFPAHWICWKTYKSATVASISCFLWHKCRCPSLPNLSHRLLWSAKELSNSWRGLENECSHIMGKAELNSPLLSRNS